MSDVIRVLAVDDVPVNLMVVRGCLKGDAFSVTTCTNAVDALQIFKEQYFDVLLLDIIMPGIDGLELWRLIRAIDSERPIIFLTSMTEDKNMTLLNKITWDVNTYYLNKSAGRKILTQKITEVVSASRSRQNERKYLTQIEKERIVAGGLQQMLLGPWCYFDGKILFSTLYLPYMHVSGDLYEIIPFGDSKYFFFIGDIAGHGLSAALFMAVVQSWLKTALRNPETRVHELMTDLNRFFCEDLRSGNYMTALAAVLDFKTNHISLHSAGHPPIVMVSPSKRSFQHADADKGSIPIGLLADTVYSEADNFEADFEEDTIFIAGSDGILDSTTDSGETLQLSELLELMACVAYDSDVVSTPFRIKGTMEKMGYTVNTDDTTIMAFQKFVPRKNTLRRVIPSKLQEVDPAALEFSAVTEDPVLSMEIDLCIREYLNNIILHGRKGRAEAAECIYLSIGEEHGELVLTGAERSGEWNFTNEQDPENKGSAPEETSESPEDAAASEGTEANADPDEGLFRIGGRGIQILNAITRSISYESNCGLNETKFIFKMGTEKP